MPWDFGSIDTGVIYTSETDATKALAPDGLGGVLWSDGFLLASGQRAGGADYQQVFDHGVVINEGGYDSDFRIESTTEPYAFWLDASLGRVGINTTTGLTAALSVTRRDAGAAGDYSLLQLARVNTVDGTGTAGTGGYINWIFGNTTGTQVEAAKLDAVWNIATAGSESTRVSLWAMNAGAMALFLHNYAPSSAAFPNLFIGLSAGNITMTGNGANVGIGAYALDALTSAVNNVAIGYDALGAVTTGNSNLAIGYQALRALTSGTANTALGSLAGYSMTGAINGCRYNVLIGNSAGYSLSQGINKTMWNTAIGTEALYTATTSIFCVAIGAYAGKYETGDYKLFIDGLNRTDEATGRIKSMIYGEFSATATSQLLRFNAVTDFHMLDAATNAATTTHKLRHNTTGTVAAGFGTTQQWQLESSTTDDRDAAAITTTWATATDASRAARMTISVYDTAVRECIRYEASGSAPMIGFFGNAAVAQQTLATYTSDGEGTDYTGIDNAQAGTVYAAVADLNTLRVAYETLRASYDDLRTKLQTSTIVA